MSTRRTRTRAWSAGRPLGVRPSRRRSVPDTAEQLERLFRLLPLAARPDGASLDELAAELGVDVATVLADLREIQERDLYHPSESGADVQIVIEAGRVYVWTKHDLERPSKLTLPEALALWLGLEIVRVSNGQDADGRAELAARLRRHLVRQPDSVVEAVLAAPALTEDPGDLRWALSVAITESRVCRLSYLKASAARPEERRVRPYRLVHAEGSWYLLGHCEEAGAVRAFRLDRVLAVETDEERFEVPPHFDPAVHFDGDASRVLDATAHDRALVRYSARIARWLAEREEGEWLEDGSFAVHRPVADPEWLVRHVLQYAGEAEVIDPPELRALVASAARRIAEGQGAAAPRSVPRARRSPAGDPARRRRRRP